MSLTSSLISASTEEVTLTMPPIVYAGIAAAAFIAFGLVVWSYRDVANRHSDKTSASENDHHTPGH